MGDGVLRGKVGLVFGVANQRSIAWGIARAWAQEGAQLFLSYQGERIRANVEELAQSLRDEFGTEVELAPCDVAHDSEIAAFFEFVKSKTARVDLLLHSLAFAPREALEGRFSQTSREAFSASHDISVYSLVALARETAPLMTEGGSILAMTFLGAQKVVPNYNVMGVAKAALEASVRYLASDLGPRNIRVNAISAGPMQTLAARGIADFPLMLKFYQKHAPLGRSCTLDELGATGVFLATDGAAAITGQVLYVDGGYEILGMPELNTEAREAAKNGDKSDEG
jgi:enoyl-[acyl-carrier protein] reductase I